MNVFEKLQQCRVDLQKLKLKKGGKNKFANFEYYELADFIPAVNELFLKYKLHSRFSIVNDNGKDMATLTIVNTENTEEMEVFMSPIADAEVKGCTPIQCLGGVHTYMKRYLYQNALEIVEPDLLDTVVGKKLENSKQPTNDTPSGTDYRQILVNYCQANNLSMTDIAKEYKLNAKSTQKDFMEVLDRMGVEC